VIARVGTFYIGLERHSFSAGFPSFSRCQLAIVRQHGTQEDKHGQFGVVRVKPFENRHLSI
jgi:hypothetical protein